MCEVAELVGTPLVQVTKDKCPFCDKAPHAFPAKTQEPNVDSIVSKPSQLGCADLGGGRPGKYSTAKHHMIPAIQCFKQVRRLAAMALSVGYDINNPPNGIPLPTVCNKYEDRFGKVSTFGALDDDDKKTIRNRIMKALGQQWHVGNHHYDIPGEEDETGNMQDEGSLDHLPYDIVVVRRLLQILKKLYPANLCEKGKQDKVKELIHQLEDEIRDKLNSFSDPKASKPYYVSLAALLFSEGS